MEMRLFCLAFAVISLVPSTSNAEINVFPQQFMELSAPNADVFAKCQITFKPVEVAKCADLFQGESNRVCRALGFLTDPGHAGLPARAHLSPREPALFPAPTIPVRLFHDETSRIVLDEISGRIQKRRHSAPREGKPVDSRDFEGLYRLSAP